MSSDECNGVKLLKQRFLLLITEYGANHGLNFKPCPDDVIVVTPPKCGTTWMQQIVHQLRSGGDMSFEEIGDVVPFIEQAYDLQIDLNAEHNYQPRCYKSHAWYPYCPKGGKYIVIYRDPYAACYSFFNFFNGWYFQPGEVSLHEFVRDIPLAGSGVPKTKAEFPSYFAHLVSWWEHRNDSNVLLLFYEDMKEDLESAVREVAAFIEIEDEEKIKKAVEMSSFEFMKKNERKFSSVRVARYRNVAIGLPADLIPSKVVSGSATKGRELMDEKTKEIIQAKWLEVVRKQIGFKDYDELRMAFKKEKCN